MRVLLRQGGLAVPADLDLEEEVRRARLLGDDEVLHPPWTGRNFRRLAEIPELAEAFDAPDARFAAFLRANRVPFASLGLAAIVGIAGALQLGAADLGGEAGAARAQQMVMKGALGYETLLLDGAWWAPWTSQLLHATPLHLAMNLPVLAYCGHRVERAYGAGAFAVVAAAAVLGGTCCVAAFGALPVIGASILAFGLWGAQITIGFRAGAALPVGWRGFYGWGNLVLFLPLVLSSLGAPGVSHLAHLGGLLGGIAAAALVRAEAFAARAHVRRRQRANIAIALALGVLPMLAPFALDRLPAALVWPAEHVEAPGAGVTLALPWRMAQKQEQFAGLPSWGVSANHDEPIFCGLVYLKAPATPDARALAEAWGAALEADVEPIPAAGGGEPPLVAGWTRQRFAVRERGTGTLRGTLVEQDLRRGLALVRAGYFVATDAGPAREAVYARVLATLEVRDPPALAEARRKRLLYPGDPEVAYTFAEQLVRAGEPWAAVPVWEELERRADDWRWEAVRGRLRMWTVAEPGTEPEMALPARDEWLTAALALAPAGDGTLYDAALRRLVADGACTEAAAWWSGFEARDPDPALHARLASALDACDAPVAGSGESPPANRGVNVGG